MWRIFLINIFLIFLVSCSENIVHEKFDGYSSTLYMEGNKPVKEIEMWDNGNLKSITDKIVPDSVEIEKNGSIFKWSGLNYRYMNYYETGVLRDSGCYYRAAKVGVWKYFNIEGELDSLVLYEYDPDDLFGEVE